MTTLATLLHTTFLANPLRRMLIHGAGAERPLTAGALDRAARAGAAVLATVPHPPDRPARIGLLADNGPDTVVALLAAIYAGATICPLHATSPLVDLQRTAQALALDAIIADPPRRALAAETGLGIISARALGTANGPGEAPRTIDGDTPALLLTTSGTTGKPRAVVITARSLATHTQALATQVLGLGLNDRVLAALPVAHSFGCRMALLAPLIAGATIVLAPRFSATATLRMLAEHHITWAPVVPTMLAAWVARDIPPLPSLRWVLSAGAPLPDGLRRDAETRLGVAVRQGYGLTEASFCCIDAPPAPAAPGTVGRPVPGVEVRIVPEPGQDPSTPGDIEVRGTNTMARYLDDADATADMWTSDGWLRTGDVGHLSSDGYLIVVDRRKDIILSGGHTIHPAEVENALREHPDVAAAAVVGLPDTFLGETVVAFVVLVDGATADTTALAAHAATRLADWKVPRHWRFVRALPTGPGGKVLRRALRESGVS
jgi:long-chain acyl-CoA synthetase